VCRVGVGGMGVSGRMWRGDGNLCVIVISGGKACITLVDRDVAYPSTCTMREYACIVILVYQNLHETCETLHAVQHKTVSFDTVPLAQPEGAWCHGQPADNCFAFRYTIVST